jgi:hypothetical protein
MKNIFFVLTSTLLLSSGLLAQQIFDTPLSQRVTSYTIDVTLNTDAKTVEGSVVATWVNQSDDMVASLQMHMYLNAFRSNKSTFHRESGGSPGVSEKDFGWIDLTSISTADGEDLINSISYIQPDDGNSDDMSVLEVNLPKPVAPGDRIDLHIGFISKLPSTIIRTGYADNFFFVAQWFPKFGVYEFNGMGGSEVNGWNCHQFHSKSEFYSNHSLYKVDITLPSEYVIGSGGILVSETAISDSLKRVSYRAEDIVDFAWTAWPEYLVAEDKWNHVDIRFMYPPGRDDQIERQIGAVKNALEYFTNHIGPYPWPHLTLVDPPAKGGGAGGMEYTTIFTSGSTTGIPEFMLLPEMVTVHEFGHSYFMGILATNEFEEPWMDEGMNSYWETRVMDHYWGPDKGVVNHKRFWLSDKTMQRIPYVKSSDNMVIDNTPFSWSYPHGTYGMMSYSKVATWLNTMEGLLGTDTMDEIFREFYREWGFKHPVTQDFIDVANRVVKDREGDRFGEGMDWFFEQTLFGSGICDYKLDGISNSKIRSFKGVVKSDSGNVLLQNKTLNDSIYISIVRVQRLGEVMLPVEILVHFDNGTELLEFWDGKARYFDLEYEGTSRIEWAKIDPEVKLSMDINLVNNSYAVDPDHTPVKRVIRRFATYLLFFTQLISL